MGIIELLIVSIVLAIDAFTVSISKGLSHSRLKLSHYLKVGIWFGGFQALMPMFGYYCSIGLNEYISAFDHWIAFGLLFIIGSNIIRQSLSSKDEEGSNQWSDYSIRTMLMLAIATSIDALAMGVSFAILNVNIFIAISIIGVVTLSLSMIGLKIGKIVGNKFKQSAELIGGIVLILLGIKILLEHIL